MTENEKHLYDHFLISIKSGFLSLEDIIDESLEIVEDEGWTSEISQEWIEENVRKEYLKHEAQSQGWNRPTDTEKLHRVFDSLCGNGIIALHNAGYTVSDAVYDAQDLWKDLVDGGLNPIGYCYYHGQDLERVIETGTLCIGFSGQKEKNDKEAIIIGNKVAGSLKDAGFTIEWNGSASQRIKIQNFNWQNTFTSHDHVDEKWGHERIFDLMK